MSRPDHNPAAAQAQAKAEASWPGAVRETWTDAEGDVLSAEFQAMLARAGHADIVAVGNEVLLREDMSDDELLDHIQRVKQALLGVPVGYADAYFRFEKYPRVTAACDVVMTNCNPFWEG